MGDDELPIELELAIERYERNQLRIAQAEGAGSEDYALSIAGHLIDRFCDDLQALVHATGARRKGGTHAHRLQLLLAKLDPDVLALAILQGALTSIANREPLRQTHISVGNILHNEVWAAGLSDRKRGGVERKLRCLPSYQRRMHAVGRGTKAERREHFGLTDWTQKMLVHAGNWAINALLEYLPDTFVTIFPKGSREHFLIIHEDSEAHKRATDLVGELILRRPVWLPQPTPPLPWTDLNKGATDDPRLSRSIALVRTRSKRVQAEVRASIKSGEMMPVLQAVNAVQSVPWRINKPVMHVMKACVGVVDVKGLPLPGKRDLLFDMDLKTAEAMSAREAFYCAANLDWRGRAYGVPIFNFQRGDHVRSLFLFARGVPMTPEGLYWLKVHVANCGDFDKISKRPFDERVKWVDAKIRGIENMATVPMNELWWTQADKPWLFLAACMELSTAVAAGPTHVSHLPVSFDGSCSGLQHLCAMTRAEEGHLVNLTPSAEPQDVYQIVADRAKARIERDLDNEDKRQIAQICLDFGISRTLVKRNVMTYSYSSKAGGPGADGRLHGMAGQHWEDTMRPLQREVREGKREEHPFGADYGRAACLYLAKHIYGAIEDVVQKPANAMRLLQKLAKALAHEGKPLRWRTPTGLPWINEYHESNLKEVRLWLHDRGVKVRLSMHIGEGFKKEIDKSRVANGVAPNFVHALDAAHLAMVVNASAAEGIVDLATVHDSFGCHAAHAARFRQIIREQFVQMYSAHDPLEEVYQQAAAALTNMERLPERVSKGSLEITDVLRSEFSFA